MTELTHFIALLREAVLCTDEAEHLQSLDMFHVLSVPQMSLTGTERVGVEQDFDERSEIEFEPGPGQKLAVMVATEECPAIRHMCHMWATRC